MVLCLPRGLDAYMAILGVLEAGACYVPIDWTFPQDRADFVADDASVRAVVTLSERAAAFAAPGRAMVVVDAELGDIAAQPSTPLTRQETGATPEDEAYVIYTSGSTGRPKGVRILQRNACHLVRSESAILDLTCDDRVFGGFSLAFDMSVETMWSAWFVGAEVLAGSEALAKAGPDLAPVLTAAGVTVWHAVPSLLAVIDQDVPGARLINLGGEACPAELARRWSLPGRRLLNTYGPTETTVTATWTELAPGAPVTIGKPLPGYLGWVVDEHLNPVPDGTEGELLLGGPGVGPGYINRDDLTAQKFVTAPFAGPDGAPAHVYRSGDLVRIDARGDIDFLGRIDTQVKIRGYRVELGEIESVVAQDPAVAQAVVNLYEEADGSQLLAAFVVPRAGATVDVERVKSAMRERLPAYMRPAVYATLRALPTLISGKVDRKALARPEHVAPRRARDRPAGHAPGRQAARGLAPGVRSCAGVGDRRLLRGPGRPLPARRAHGVAGARRPFAARGVDPGPLRRPHHPGPGRPAGGRGRAERASGDALPARARPAAALVHRRPDGGARPDLRLAPGCSGCCPTSSTPTTRAWAGGWRP